jgi:hypothetical protein
MFAVPCNAGREILDVFAKRIVLVPRPRKRDIFPRGVIEYDAFRACRIADEQPPFGVEIVRRPRERTGRGENKNCEGCC